MDAEIKDPSVENPELINGLCLKPGVGHNIATHASPAARSFFLVLISTFQVLFFLFSFFFSKYLPTF